jgi:hypothetical protein
VSDIVPELREIQRSNTTLHGAQMAARAADEIERLRDENAKWKLVVCKLYGDFMAQIVVAKSNGLNPWDVRHFRSPAAPTDEASQEDGA